MADTTTDVVLLARVGMVTYSTIQPVEHEDGETASDIAETALEISDPIAKWTRTA